MCVESADSFVPAHRSEVISKPVDLKSVPTKFRRLSEKPTVKAVCLVLRGPQARKVGDQPMEATDLFSIMPQLEVFRALISTRDIGAGECQI